MIITAKLTSAIFTARVLNALPIDTTMTMKRIVMRLARSLITLSVTMTLYIGTGHLNILEQGGFYGCKSYDNRRS
jgi:hypothetical protein